VRGARGQIKAFEVKKFKKATDTEIPRQFYSTVDRSKAEEKMDELNAGLPPGEKDDFEFRICEGPSRISIGSY
jgi:hypothetical protein